MASADTSELDAWPPFIAEVAADALKFVARHPRAALSQARVAIEAICVHVHKREIGEPGKLLLDELIRKLVAKKLVSPQRELPIRTVQAWGNYGAHPIDFAKIDPAFVAPCLAAMNQVVEWYFVEYLRETLPPAFEKTAVSNARKGAAIVIISGAMAGRSVPLMRGHSVSIGRDPRADVHLDDSKVHRAHARIEFPATGRPVLHEVTAKNPTRINDVKIAGREVLRHGDHVQVGRTILRLELLD